MKDQNYNNTGFIVSKKVPRVLFLFLTSGIFK